VNQPNSQLLRGYMPDKKVIPLRFYPKTDADLIEWLEGLAAGEGNETIKVMLRAGITAL